MKQRPQSFSIYNMVWATERAKDYTKSILKQAEDITKDSNKKERIKRHECKACFYAGRLGGSSMTTRPCMSCNVDVMYGSTATDVLCMDCAKLHSLCKHCGGDLEMRVRRKEWPKCS